MTVLDINPKTFPEKISANTIYMLQAGIYTSKGDVIMPSCTALIGVTKSPTESVIIKTDSQAPNTIAIKGNNIIIDNIHIDGEYDIHNESHTPNDN